MSKLITDNYMLKHIASTFQYSVLTGAEVRSRLVISNDKPSSVFLLKMNTKSKLITNVHQQ